MISVVTFKWSKRGYRSTFTSENVNISRRNFARHYPYPHRFICVTDDPVGLDADVEYVPLWNDHADIANPTWPSGPSCYRRLKVFSEDFAQIAGDRILHIDLDMVFTGDLRPLINRAEDFVIWGTGNPKIPYCASMFLLKTGSLTKVWKDFNPKTSPQLTHRSGYRGSDQAWINYILGKNIPTWSTKDGVYSYQDHLLKKHLGALPENAKVVIFHGKPDPWDDAAIRKSAWIKDYYY